MNERVDANSASIAKTLVEMLVERVAESRAKAVGFSAEQLARKVEGDPSSGAYLKYLIKEMKDSEIERLLLRVIPERHVILEQTTVAADPFADELIKSRETLALEQCFRTAYTEACEDIQVKVAEKYIDLLKEGTEVAVFRYEDAFFTAKQLIHLAQNEREIVKLHIFDRMKRDMTSALLRTLDGIGGFLEADDAVPFIDPLVRKLITQKEPEPRIDILGFCRREVSETSGDFDSAACSRIEAWITTLSGKHPDRSLESLQTLLSVFQWDDPFGDL